MAGSFIAGRSCHRVAAGPWRPTQHLGWPGTVAHRVGTAPTHSRSSRNGCCPFGPRPPRPQVAASYYRTGSPMRRWWAACAATRPSENPAPFPSVVPGWQELIRASTDIFGGQGPVAAPPGCDQPDAASPPVSTTISSMLVPRPDQGTVAPISRIGFSCTCPGASRRHLRPACPGAAS